MKKEQCLDRINFFHESCLLRYIYLFHAKGFFQLGSISVLACVELGLVFSHFMSLT